MVNDLDLEKAIFQTFQYKRAEPNPELKHYGVVGMKWGKKKGNKVPSTDRKFVNDAQEQVRTNGLESLSDDQLRKVNKRLEMETAYKRLNPSAVKRGHESVKVALAIAGTMVSIYGLKESQLGKALISKALKK